MLGGAAPGTPSQSFAFRTGYDGGGHKADGPREVVLFLIGLGHENMGHKLKNV